ncbi:MAG: four helix bundle protein [Pirellulales bacterium]
MNQKEGAAIVDLATRTKAFALRIIRLFGALPKKTEAQVLGKQLLDSGTSVGAHYREATRARSTAQFVSKGQGGLAELEETAYWLELLAESGIIRASRLHDIQREAGELTAILVTCANNASKKDPKRKARREVAS